MQHCVQYCAQCCRSRRKFYFCNISRNNCTVCPPHCKQCCTQGCIVCPVLQSNFSCVKSLSLPPNLSLSLALSFSFSHSPPFYAKENQVSHPLVCHLSDPYRDRALCNIVEDPDDQYSNCKKINKNKNKIKSCFFSEIQKYKGNNKAVSSLYKRFVGVLERYVRT